MKRMSVFLLLIILGLMCDLTPLSFSKLRKDTIRVNVQGEVEKEGEYELDLYSTVQDALDAAGISEDADTSGIEPMSSKDYFKLLYGTGTGSAGGESDVAADGKVYTMFALQNEGYLVESKEADMESILTLKEDGTGSMTMDEDAADIASWTVDGDSILITMDDGSFAKGKYLGDIIELDILGGGSMIIYYATEDADISGYDLMTIEELREAYNKGN